MTGSAPRSFLSGVVWNAVIMGISWPLAVATAVVLGRLLGPAGKGEFALAGVVAGLLLTVFQLGVPASISYHLGGGRLPVDSLVKTVLLLAAVLSLLAIGGTWALEQLGWSRYVFGVRWLPATVWVMVLGLPFQLAGTFLQFVVLAGGQRVLFGALPTLGQIASVLLMAAFFARGALTPFTAAIALVASQALTGLILMGYQQWRVRWLQAPLARRAVWQPLLSFSAASHANAVLHFLVQRLDVLLVSTLLDLRAVGLYSVAYGVAELLLLLPQRVATLYFPRAASRSPTENREEVRTAASVILQGTVVAAGLMACAGPVAIRFLYGPAFAPAVTPFLLLLPGVCALAVSSILGTYLAGVGRLPTLLWINGLTLAATVVLNLLLIRSFGVAGAAIASSFSYGLQALLCLGATARLTGLAPLSLVTAVSPVWIVVRMRQAWQTRGTTR